MLFRSDRVLAENLISIDGEIVYKAGQKLTKEMVESLEDDQFFEKGAHQYDLTPNLNQNLLKEMAKINSQNEEAIETEDEAVLDDAEMLEDLDDALDDDMDDLTILTEEEMEDEDL